MNTIDALILYKKDLEKIIAREKIKLQKENENNKTKYDDVIAEYGDENGVMEMYGYASITERKKNQLIDIIQSGGPNAPTSNSYLDMLNLDLKAINLEIKYPDDADHIQCVSDPRVVELEKKVEELNHQLKIQKDSSSRYVDQWVDRNLKLIDENKQLTLKLKESQNKSVLIQRNARGAGAKSKFTDQEKETIKMYSYQKKTIKDLAEMFECSTGLIHKIIHE